jgi:hypothetical protein
MGSLKKGGGSEDNLLQKGKARAPRGESMNPQDVDRRVDTLFKQLTQVAAGLKREEDAGGRGGGMTFFLMATTDGADGMSKTVCYQSENLLKFTLEQAPKLLDQAQCGMWSVRPEESDREEQVKISREMFPSYEAGLAFFNANEKRTLLRVLGYDRMRKDIRSGKVPEHMREIIYKDSNCYFPLFPEHLGKEKDCAQSSGSGDDSKRDKHEEHGDDGKFVSKLGPVTSEEAAHLTNFSLWRKPQENVSEAQEKADEHESFLDIKFLVGQGEGCFEIHKGSTRVCTVALRLLLEYRQQGSEPSNLLAS